MADAAHQNELELDTQTPDLFEKNIVTPQTNATNESESQQSDSFDDQPVMSKIEARLAATRAKIEAARQKRLERTQPQIHQELELEAEIEQKQSDNEEVSYTTEEPQIQEAQENMAENIAENMTQEPHETRIQDEHNTAPESIQETKSQQEPKSQQEEKQEQKTLQKPAPKKGRPRSKKSKNAILKATNALLLRTSVQELSIEAIAKKAKVGKTTIYRWWPNKTAVVMDALKNQPGIQSHLPTPKNNADALAMQLDKLIRMLDGTNGDTIAQLFSEAQASDKARKIFAANFITPLLDAIEYSIEQGQKAGEFKTGLDTTLTADMVVGPVFFRQMTRPESMNDNFRETYPNEALRLISA